MNQTHSTCDSVEPQKCGIKENSASDVYMCALVYFLGRQHSNTRVLSELTGGLFAQMFFFISNRRNVLYSYPLFKKTFQKNTSVQSTPCSPVLGQVYTYILCKYFSGPITRDLSTQSNFTSNLCTI
jgi:hypothetical protein